MNMDKKKIKKMSANEKLKRGDIRKGGDWQNL